MNKNKLMLVASTIVFAIGSAFVSRENSPRPMASYFENTATCPASVCSSAGSLPCGHTVYLAGCQTPITNARRN